MKNIFIYKLLGLVFIAGSIISCDMLRTEEQDVSPVISPDDKPTISTTSSNISGSEVTEGDTLLFNVSIDKTLDRALTFNAKIVGGDCDDHDIEVTPGVISPYKKETTIEVVFLEDWDVESDEAIQLEFGVYGIAERYLLHPDTEFPVLDLTVKNYVADVFTLTLEWDQEIEVEEEVEKEFDTGDYIIEYLDTVTVIKNAASEVDYDFLVCPVEGFNINDPWGNFVTYAATGDYPEVFEISELEDGEYYIAYELWSNNFPYYVSVEDTTMLLTANANLTRQGTAQDEEVTMSDSQSPLIVTPGVADNDVGKTGVVAKLIVQGDDYSIVDYEGTNKSAIVEIGNKTSSRPASLSRGK